MNFWLKFVFLTVVLGLLPVIPGLAASELQEQFRSEVEEFVRTTQTLTAEATTTRAGPKSDTFTVQFAYRYPDGLMQWVQYPRGRQQIVLHRDEQAVLDFPHLDVRREGDVTEKEFQRQLRRHVPMLGLIVALGSDRKWPEGVSLSDQGDTYQITANLDRFSRTSGTLDVVVQRNPLKPLWAELSGDRTMRVETTSWKPNERLPKAYRSGIEQLDPDRVLGREEDSS